MNKLIKVIFFIIALLIAIGSFIYTKRLVKDIKQIENQRVKLWAEAYSELVATDLTQNISNVVFKMIESNTTIPVIITDNQGNIITYSNIDTSKAKNPHYIQNLIIKMQKQHKPIAIDMGEYKNYIYYLDSELLTKLRMFPIWQAVFITLFMIVVIITLHFSTKAEENKLLVAMSNETAHQLGTPISSLLAWIEMMKLTGKDALLEEVEKDIKRLEIITERFSRIGSKPKLQETNLIKLINETVEYLKKRTSKKIIFELKSNTETIKTMLNPPLFSWVIENLWKNAVDAMSGIGKITIEITQKNDLIIIDFSDTGKGLSKKNQKKVFKPGYTTKTHGWGLGLTLVKRIIEDYHKGKIFIKNSELNKGTTFRIVLKK